MTPRVACCSLVAVALAAVPLVTAAQPAPVDPYGGATYGVPSDGGAAYGGATYGGATYGGAGHSAPAVLVDDSTIGVVRLDLGGRRTVMAAPGDGRIRAHSYQALVVDEGSGRWFVTRQAKRGAVRPWTVIFGDRTGMVAEVAGDPACGARKPACFELPLAFTPDGAAVLTVSARSAGATLARYVFGRAGRQLLAGKAIATRLALARDHARAAYARRGGLTLIDWTARGPRPRDPGQAVAIGGDLDQLVMLDEAVLFRREVGRDRRRTTTLEVLDLATGDREVVYRPRHTLTWAPLPAPARGSAFVHDCDRARGDRGCDVVEVTVAGARTMARGVVRAHDVSADGRYLLASRYPRGADVRATAWPDLVVVELATGRDVVVHREVSVDSAQFTR